MFQSLSGFWDRIQGSLFPFLEKELGSLTKKQRQLVSIFELIRIEEHLYPLPRGVGRPQKDRIALARSFVAKSLYNMNTTRVLIERLHADIPLRRLCGWEERSQIPCESTFSRAFENFATSEFPKLVHTALIKNVYKDQIIVHISRDATAINGREKFKRKKTKTKVVVKKKRLDCQLEMSQAERLEDLPKKCNVGAKANSRGRRTFWEGYKCHLDVGDRDIPISCVITSASVHDSQVAIPLASETNSKVISCYDLMDSAYDCPQIIQHIKNLGHVPIVVKNARSKPVKEQIQEEKKALRNLNWKFPEEVRRQQRSSVERVNSRLKESFGGRAIQVRGYRKVYCHLMFGILALTAQAILNSLQ